jgi:AcrR family transcriptional regulator
MKNVPERSAPRDRILDAAAAVMHERGIAGATTKEIARAAGYSEAMLYKHFDDKQDIFLAVLKERIPLGPDPLALVGTATVQQNLESITLSYLRFFVRTFPMGASIFGSPELLSAHRSGIHSRGGSPDRPVQAVRAYLDGEIAEGRVGADTDAKAVAALLVGATFQQAFLACFEGYDAVPGDVTVARSLVAAVRLSPGP